MTSTMPSSDDAGRGTNRRRNTTMLEELERRVATLERSALRDAGIWQEGQRYRCGDCVTFRSTLWAAKADTHSRPFESRDWRMLAKPTRSK
jgi:hypothetical protein